ncbi:MAG: hypothetical protein ACR2RB_00550 [Gammaproteobacteria bacterium]
MSEDQGNGAAGAPVVGADGDSGPQSMLAALEAEAGFSGDLPSADGTAAVPSDAGADVASEPSVDASGAASGVSGVEASASQPAAGAVEGDAARDTGLAGEAGASDDTASVEAAAAASDSGAPDDLLDVPDGLEARAKERFTRLVDTNKTLTGERDEFRGQAEAFTTLFRDIGGTNDQVAGALNFVKLESAGDLEGALRLIDQKRADLAVRLGRPVEGIDALAKHPDLKQAVDDVLMDEGFARELAMRREQASALQGEAQARAQADSAAQAQTAQNAAYQGQVNAAVAAVEAQERRWSETDPHFQLKIDRMKPQIANIAQTYPPDQWAGQINTLYDMLSGMAAMAAEGSKPGMAPLSGSGSGAGAAQLGEPKNMLEAIERGLKVNAAA